jgi:hypothetical protein
MPNRFDAARGVGRRRIIMPGSNCPTVRPVIASRARLDRYSLDCSRIRAEPHHIDVVGAAIASKYLTWLEFPP